LAGGAASEGELFGGGAARDTRLHNSPALMCPE
jgi:hypothetical protein